MTNHLIAYLRLALDNHQRRLKLAVAEQLLSTVTNQAIPLWTKLVDHLGVNLADQLKQQYYLKEKSTAQARASVQLHPEETWYDLYGVIHDLAIDLDPAEYIDHGLLSPTATRQLVQIENCLNANTLLNP
jgi:hypothetical protein